MPVTRPAAAVGGAVEDVARRAVRNPLEATSLLRVLVVSAAAGLLADARMYRDDPSQRTMLNYGLTLAGTLPMVPSAASIVAKTGRKADDYRVFKSKAGYPDDFPNVAKSKAGAGGSIPEAEQSGSSGPVGGVRFPGLRDPDGIDISDARTIVGRAPGRNREEPLGLEAGLDAGGHLTRLRTDVSRREMRGATGHDHRDPLSGTTCRPWMLQRAEALRGEVSATSLG